MIPSRSRALNQRGTLSLFALVALFAACNGSNTGKGTPLVISEDETVANDTPATANTLPVGTPIRGDLSVAGDVDCFAVQLAAGHYLKIELLGTRNDQAGWDGNTNVPRLTLLDTTANANAKLREQDFSGNFSDGWGWGFHDLDMPIVKVPASGTYFIAVTQDNQLVGGGTYILRASYVSPTGVQEESEVAGLIGGGPGFVGTNDTFATAEPIHTGTIHGFHVAGELDYYSFTISSPTVVRFELNSYRNGVHDGTAFYYDPEINLFGTDGTTLLTGNDDTYFYDPAIQYEIDTAGTYFVNVDEFATGSGEYFLSFTTAAAAGSMETEPNDLSTTANTISYGSRRRGTVTTGETDFFKFSGTAGDMVRLQYFDNGNAQAATSSIVVSLVGTDGLTALGTGGDAQFQTLTTILQATGVYYVKVVGGVATTPYALELSRFHSSVYETEPNDTALAAGTLAEHVSGVITPGGDVDMYKVSLSKDQLVRFVCFASSSFTDSNGVEDYSGHGSSLAPLIELVDSEDVVVASSTSVPTNGVFTESVTDALPTAGLAVAVATAGTYYVRISAADATSGVTHYYVLEFERH